MGGQDKLAVEIGGSRSWRGRSMHWRRRPRSARLVVVTAAERRAAVAAAPWLPRSVIEVVVGGARRQESVRAGFAAFDRAGTGRDRRRPRPRRRPAARSPPGWSSAVAGATVGHGAAIPIVPVAETLKRIDGDLRRGDRRPERPRARPRRRRASAATSCATPTDASRPTARRRSPTRPPCSKPVASRSMSFPAIQATSR